MIRRFKGVLVAGVLFSAFGGVPAYAQLLEECGTLANAFGPFDYRTATPAQIKIVEDNHFTPVVETLSAGTSGPIGGDLDYTLRVFPNHTRALMAMARLSEREKRAKTKGAIYTTECYFDRAVRFQPEDRGVRVVYGYYLLRSGDRRGAIRELERAKELGGDTDPNVHYNLGLAYFDLGEFDKSAAQAKVAYSQGFPLPGLKEKLKKVKKWQD